MLLAFGGVAAGATYLQDLQLVRVDSGHWSNVFVHGEAPPARAKHTLTALADRSRCLLFGGGDDARLLNDVWLFDVALQQWSRPRVRGPPPTARWAHTAALCGDLLVVHGGWNGRSRLSDVHMLDTRNMCWVFMASLMGAADAKLSPVMGHAACALSDKLMLVWGGGDGRLADESALFDVERAKWTIVPRSAPPLCGHTLSVIADQIFCFGGSDGVSLFNDVLVPRFADSIAPARSLADKFLDLCAALSRPTPMVKLTPVVLRPPQPPPPPPQPVVVSPVVVRRPRKSSSPVLRARSPLIASSPVDAAASTSPPPWTAVVMANVPPPPPAWAAAVGLGAFAEALAREEIGEDVLRHLTVAHLEALGVGDAHERFAVLQAIEARYGGARAEAATHLLAMQVQQASTLISRSATELASAIDRLQQQQQQQQPA